MNDFVRTEDHPEPRPAVPTPAADDGVQITVDQIAPGAVAIRLAGDIDLLTAGALRETVWPHLDRPGQSVLLDLNGVGFLGSSGLSELVAANEQARKNGVSLLLVAGVRAVLRPLEITGLASLFRVFDTVDEALRAESEATGGHV